MDRVVHIDKVIGGGYRLGWRIWKGIGDMAQFSK